MRQENLVAPASSPRSRSSSTCPQGLGARGLPASGAVRSVLLVKLTYTRPVTGLRCISSGRSILVAPTRSAAPRVLISTSAWLAKPLAAVSGPRPCSSGTHVPVPPPEGALADELVEVLEALIIAHVDGHPAVLGQRGGRPLVLHAPKRGALARNKVRVVGVDLDHPAEGERLVRLLGQVEAVVVALPLAVRGALGQGVALVPGPHPRVGDRLQVGEVLVEVLLAGQHRPPGGDPAGAVVQHPLDPATARVLAGPQQLRAGGWAGEAHAGLRGDAPVVARQRPVAERSAALGPLDEHDAAAVSGQLNVDLLPGRVVGVVA